MQMDNFRRDFLVLSFFLSVLFGVFLGSRPLSVPDEGRYVEIPREMLETGDYITPRLNGVKYFEKPPLLYWAEAAILKVFGFSETSVRLLPAFLGVLGCLLIFAIAWIFWGRPEAWASSLILATSGLYYAHTRLLILDLGVTVFLSLALLSFFRATQIPPAQVSEQRKWLVGFYGGCALAVLTKGIIGALIPGCIILLWTIPWKRWAFLKLAFQPWGILLFCAVVLPWHIAVSLENPEFPNFYFIHEHFTRFTTTVHGRFKPWWFFIPIVAVGLFPWVCFMGQAFLWAVRQKKDFSESLLSFLSVWIVFILVFFSCSHSKLIPYILPIFPPLALVIGAYIGRMWRENVLTREIYWGMAAFGIVCVFLVGALPFALNRLSLLDPLLQEGFFVPVFVLVNLMGVFLPKFFVARRSLRWALGSVASVTMGLLMVIQMAWPLLDNRSIKPLALTLQEKQKQDYRCVEKGRCPVICYEKYYQDLPVYLGHIVDVVSWRGELDFGMRQEDTSRWMISHETFWDRWKSDQKIFLILPKETFRILRAHQSSERPFIFIQETHRDVLVTNQ